MIDEFANVTVCLSGSFTVELQQCLVTKQAIRASLRRDLPAALLEESQLLVKTWISDEFQTRALNHIGATKSHAES